MRSSSVSSLSRSSGSSQLKSLSFNETAGLPTCCSATDMGGSLDRKSTRLNSSHLVISYAVFCLKKKKKKQTNRYKSVKTRSTEIIIVYVCVPSTCMHCCRHSHTTHQSYMRSRSAHIIRLQVTS